MKKPNIVSTILSVAACKLTRFVLRKTGRGGTAIPGIVAMKVCPNILAAVSDGMKIVVVTGTNGKTTTCNMIEHALTSAGYDCLLNKSGANLLHGIASDLITSATWLGKAKHPYAVLECDEAALKQVVPFLNPRAIVVTNLFSDQVDRYGGVENTKKEIRTGIERSPESILVLNADEPLTASLGLNVPNRVLWYGLEKGVGVRGNVDLSDAGVCPCCGSNYVYDSHIYAHLGSYRCPQCGYSRPVPNVAVTSIDRMSADGSSFHIRTELPGLAADAARSTQSTGTAVGDRTAGAAGNAQTSAVYSQEVFLSLPAVYNIYNSAASVTAALAMGVSSSAALSSLGSVSSSFGRLETFNLNGNRLQMILVKNPAGCNQAFSYLTGLEEDFSAVLCLNNRTGDGHDISWIENTDYEKLCQDPHLRTLYVGGDCKDALYDRLVRAGAPEDRMVRFTDYASLVTTLSQEPCPVFLLPNYTAMMELRGALSVKTGTKDFWE